MRITWLQRATRRVFNTTTGDKNIISNYFHHLKKGKLFIKKTSDSLKNSEVQKYYNLVKPRNMELPVIERMKKDWDDRAEMNARFFIFADLNLPEKKFWDSGKKDCENILGINTPRHDLILNGKEPKNMRVLEIGCGIGRILVPMAKIFGEAIGVDVSKKMVELAQKHITDIPNCKVLHTNGIDISMFENNYFDFCYSFIVFQHIPEKNIVINYIKEISRVLKPQGLFRFQVHGDYDNALPDGSTWNGVHFTKEEINQIAKENKFEIVEEDGSNSQYYMLTFKSTK